ncbi:GNAT family N-acetyltransferase [Bordetella trematum]|uniref:GNAT family N-acetyltransferase n=1 Tax=Bordetella trematum TaxID=123899 RepID=UPI000F62CE7D|nr:GNAT family N-acetyltransferase [Bordetella trematum]
MAPSAAMGDWRCASLSGLSIQAMAGLMGQAYAGYLVPVQFEAASLLRRVLAEHIDLQASQQLFDGDEPAGILLVARRGRDSRIAALGVVPGFRGRGLGAWALQRAREQACERGDRCLSLEVIDGNAAARAVYDKAGFVARRRLVGYRHNGAGPGGRIQAASVQTLIERCLRAYPADMTWQASPLCLAGVASPLLGFESRDGAAVAVVDPIAPVLRLVAFAVDPARRRQGLGRRFMRDLLGQFPGRSWVIPAILPDTLADGFLRATAWERTALTQSEMILALDEAASVPG